MKLKLLSLLVVPFISFGVIGCGETETEEAAEDATEAVEEAAEETAEAAETAAE